MGQDGLFDGTAVGVLPDGIVIVEDLAEEVTAEDRMLDLFPHAIRQPFLPVERIARQGQVEGDDILDTLGMHSPVSDRRAANRVTVPKGRRRFVVVAFEIVAHGAGEDGREIVADLLDTRAVHTEQQVMRVAIPELVHPRRQVAGQQLDGYLEQPVGQCAAEAQPGRNGIEAGLQLESGRYPFGASMLDQQVEILAIGLGNPVGGLVQLFAGNRQVDEAAQDVAADLCQLVRIVGADIEDLRGASAGECVEADGEDA